MTMQRLTKHQRAALDILARDDRWWRPGDLADILGTSPEGAAATASSLVRRGLARRRTFYGLVHYQITGEGRFNA